MSWSALAAAVLVGAPPLRCVADIPDAFLQSPALELIQKGSASEADAELWAKSCTCLGINYPDWLKTDFQRTDPAARIGLITSLASGAFKNEWSEVQAAKLPVTLLIGDNDPFVNRDFLGNSLLLKNVSAQRVEIVSDAGHVTQWDAPTSFNRILAQCVQTLRYV